MSSILEGLCQCSRIRKLQAESSLGAFAKLLAHSHVTFLIGGWNPVVHEIASLVKIYFLESFHVGASSIDSEFYDIRVKHKHQWNGLVEAAESIECVEMCWFSMGTFSWKNPSNLNLSNPSPSGLQPRGMRQSQGPIQIAFYAAIVMSCVDEDHMNSALCE